MINDKEYLIVMTDIDTGKSVYVHPHFDGWMKCLKTSSSIPIVTRDFYTINSMNVIDDGLSYPIPV